MRNTDTPKLETIEQFRDNNGALWCVQFYYPKGKRHGNDRYWLATIAKVGTTESITCADIWHLERELGKLKNIKPQRPQRALFDELG
jgi:hypothetical protein